MTDTGYDATGQPRQLLTTIGTTVTSIIDKACSDLLGRPLSIAHANTVSDTFQYHGAAGSASFAEGHALKRITVTKGTTTPAHLDLQCQDYDKRGLLKTLVDTADVAPRSNTASYTYDFARRLQTIVATSTMEASFSYDTLGNIRTKGTREFFYDTPTKPHQMTGVKVSGGALKPIVHENRQPPIQTGCARSAAGPGV